MQTAEEIEARFLKSREARAQRKAEISTRDAEHAELMHRARAELSELLESSGKVHDQILAEAAAATAHHPAVAGENAGGVVEAAGDVVATTRASPQMIAKAMAEWRTLQTGVQRIINHVKLPAHDVQVANTALAKRLQAIENARIGKAATSSSVDASAAAQATSSSANNSGKVAAAGRRFRFRRLEGYSHSSEEDSASNAAASSSLLSTASSYPQSVASATVVSSATTGSSSSGGDQQGNNARQNLEPGSYLIVAKQACFLRKSSNCTLYFPPVGGSVFLVNLTDCTVYVACRQLRMKDCINCNVYVCCASTPVIEDSKNIRFGGFSALWASSSSSSSSSAETTIKARLGTALNLQSEQAITKRLSESYRSVDDFTWLRSSPSPHWTLMMPHGEWAAAPSSVLEAVLASPNDASESCTKL